MEQFSTEALSRLENAKWRASQSRWRFWIYLSFGMLGIVGFAKIAIRTKDKTLRRVALAFSGSTTLLFILMSSGDTSNGEPATSTTSTASTVASYLMMANFAAQVFASFKYNKIWLAFQAENRSDGSWVAQNFTSSQSIKLQTPTVSGNLQKLGVDPGDYYQETIGENSVQEFPAAPDSPPVTDKVEKEIADLNTASRETLLKVPGFSSELVEQTLFERDKRNGFSSFEEFVSVTNLQPHQILKIRPHVEVQKMGSAQNRAGRILDF